MSGPDPRIGTVLHDRYLILQRLAAGAMAVVYRGERLRLKRPVAIKFLQESYASSDDGMRRFEREAMVMSQLSHPNCVAVTDFGSDQGAPYLVMDFINGRSLREVQGVEPRLPAGRAVEIVRQLLAGLTHAHGHGIVHRDIKPENILLSPVEGHGEQVRILDFGLAKLQSEGTNTTGMAIGTPSYMSPEQTIGERADEHADVYSTGIILYELLTGTKPFHAESAFDLMRLHREAAAPPLAQAAPDLRFSAALEEVVARALAKQREARFPSAGAFLTALEATPEARGVAVAAETVSRRSGLAIAVAVVVAAVVVALALAQ
jgi:eukaryotic-like serine/threonine-protein kinase